MHKKTADKFDTGNSKFFPPAFFAVILHIVTFPWAKPGTWDSICFCRNYSGFADVHSPHTYLCPIWEDVVFCLFGRYRCLIGILGQKKNPQKHKVSEGLKREAFYLAPTSLNQYFTVMKSPPANIGATPTFINVEPFKVISRPLT